MGKQRTHPSRSVILSKRSEPKDLRLLLALLKSPSFAPDPPHRRPLHALAADLAVVAAQVVPGVRSRGSQAHEQNFTEGAGAFRPLNKSVRRGGFSHGPSAEMRFAPQETRTYLVTAVTAGRRSLFQVAATAELLQRTIFHCRTFVIMPDHFHGLITPAREVSLEKAVQFIKGGFSFRLKSKLDVWMRSFNESQIQSEEKFLNCVRYIEKNPVRRGLVPTPEEYPFSSAVVKPSDPIPTHLRNSGNPARA